MSKPSVPEGFAAMPLDGSFNDAFAPVYFRMGETGPEIGLQVDKKHLNPMGICHGAVYMALFDIAFACAIGHSIGKYTGTPTMNINIDFMAASKEGEWLQVNARCLKTTRTAGFAQGEIVCGEATKASGSGLFRLPDNLATALEMGDAGLPEAG
ncbi:MAG: hypothetical protein CMN85_11510 [Spongiibacteraceae bacterium]|nr:hypothetical protein [Spongiibacteraceae bacterium]